MSTISSVAYKKGNWMRYSLWALAAVCIGVMIYTFVDALNSEVSATVPEGYHFAVTNNYSEGSKIRTTYYVYDDRILVEDESFADDEVNRAVMIYDDLNTSSLRYDPSDTTTICELGSCHESPKIIDVIKRLLARKVGREYIGL